MKYIGDVRKQFNSPRFPVFRASELRTIGIGKDYVKRLAHLLIAKGEIIRITRGIYTFHDNAYVVGFAFSPFYYGLEDALRIRGLSEQGTNPLVVTTRNVRGGLRKFGESNYVIYKIEKEYFFGYNMEKRDGFWVPVSDLEKTVIDMLYFQGGIRDELWPGILERLDRKRIREYLKRYDAKFGKRVLDEIRAGGALKRDTWYAANLRKRKRK